METVQADAVRVTAILTRRQATAVLRSVPWGRRALVRWSVNVLATGLSGVPVVVALTGSLRWGAAMLGLLAVALGNTFLAAPWSAPRSRPAAHGVDAPVTWELSADGIAMWSVMGSGFRPWSSVDAVEQRGDLLVVADRGHHWATGVPLDLLPTGAVERVRAWHAAAPAEQPPAEPLARRDGEDLVVVARPDRAQVREPLVGWTRVLHRSPAPLLVLVALLGVLVAGVASGDPLRVRAALATPLALLLVAAVAETAVRREARRSRVHGYRISAHGLSYAVGGAWQHVPWARVTRVTLARAFLVVSFKDLGGPVALPIAGLPPDAAVDIARWCRDAGVRVRDHRGRR